MEMIITWIVSTIARLGYPGIIILMFLESSFFPFPSEVVIPPAGYLASQGVMNIWIVILAGISGSLLGSLFNYYLAYWLGRPLLIKFGKYFFLTPERMAKVDSFFLKHGEISTFTGRLITVVRQYISFPAGLTRMNIIKFCCYTSAGAGIWVLILAYIGFVVGNNIELVQQYSKIASILLLVFIAILFTVYIVMLKRKKVGKQA